MLMHPLQNWGILLTMFYEAENEAKLWCPKCHSTSLDPLE